MSDQTKFSFGLDFNKVFKDDQGKRHVLAIASDNLPDSDRERMSDLAVQSMVSDAKNNRVRIIDNHRATIPFGRSSDAELVIRDDGALEFLIDIELDDRFPQADALYDSVSMNTGEYQLSIGAFIDHSKDDAILWDSSGDQVVRVINRVNLDHVALTPADGAANPRTRFITAMSKALDDNGWENQVENDDFSEENIDNKEESGLINNDIKRYSQDEVVEALELANRVSAVINSKEIPVTDVDTVEETATENEVEIEIAGGTDETTEVETSAEKSESESSEEVVAEEASAETEEEVDKEDETTEEVAESTEESTEEEAEKEQTEEVTAEVETAEETAEVGLEAVKSLDNDSLGQLISAALEEKESRESQAKPEFDAAEALMSLAESFKGVEEAIKSLKSTIEGQDQTLKSLDSRVENIENIEGAGGPNASKVTKSVKTPNNGVFAGIFGPARANR